MASREVDPAAPHHLGWGPRLAFSSSSTSCCPHSHDKAMACAWLTARTHIVSQTEPTTAPAPTSAPQTHETCSRLHPSPNLGESLGCLTQQGWSPLPGGISEGILPGHRKRCLPDCILGTS